ncbi:hypothetical protein OAT84_01420 [Gammaproteobacteria bacterium]|nr:hypothetical protein [Gammaproteobacteria bacterium]
MVALVNAVATSLALIGLSMMLRPVFILIPYYIYQGVTLGLFVCSTICWFMINYPGIKSYMLQKAKPETIKEKAERMLAEADKDFDHLNEYLVALDSEKFPESNYKAELYQQIKEKANTAYAQSERVEEVHNVIMRSTSWGTLLYRLAYKSRLLRAILPAFKFHNQHLEYAEICKELSKQIHESMRNNKINQVDILHSKNSEIISVVFDKLLAKLPPHPSDNTRGCQSNYISNYTTRLKSMFYAVFSNSSTLMIFCGIEFLALIGPVSPVLASIVLGTFLISGYISAYGLEKPIVDAYIKLQYTLSNKSKRFISRLREHSQRISILSLQHKSRDALAYLISITAGITYFMSSTALAEILFGNIYFSNITLITKVAMSPLSASIPAIAFGLVSGLISFEIISSLLLSNKYNLPKSSDLSIHGASIKKQIQIASIATCFAFSALIIQNLILEAFVFSSILPLLSSAIYFGVVVSLIRLVYDFYDNEHSIFTKICFTSGLVSNILAGGIMSGVSGSIYDRIFGRLPAIAVGVATTTANTEHLAPLFVKGADQLNQVITSKNNTSKQVAAGA